MKHGKNIVFIFSLILFLFSNIANAQIAHIKYTPRIQLDSGPIVGKIENNLRVFLGIPYAAPPVGKLRWQPPKPVSHWQKVRSSIKFGHICPQPNGNAENMSEDCLSLNVWVPNKKIRKPLPVMVWIHGGAFLSGSGSFPMYDASKIAAKNVIVVTINYRLGPLGFFAHPLLTKASPHHASGNQGLLDQIAALKWVQRNIAAFGGNPKRVTVFGESAGATSIDDLLISPLAKGLFQQAIIESSPLTVASSPLKQTNQKGVAAETVGTVISQTLGCDKTKDELACLRSKSYKALWNAAQKNKKILEVGFANVIFQPTIDGYVIPKNPAILWKEGKQSPMALIIGTNANEGTFFAYNFLADVNTVARYHTYLKESFGQNAKEIYQQFPVTKDSDVFATLSKLLTVEWFDQSVNIIADSSLKQGVNIWRYHFEHKAPIKIFKVVYSTIPDNVINSLGVAHATEIPYVFGTFKKTDGTQKDVKLSQEIITYWTNFAKTGNPNGQKLPHWPSYNSHKKSKIFR